MKSITVSNSDLSGIKYQSTKIVDYNFDVKPILSDKCYSCHGPDDKARQANLRLDFIEGLSDFLDKNSGVVRGERPGDEIFAKDLLTMLGKVNKNCK